MSKSSDSFRIARAAGSKKETPNRRRPAFGIGMLHVLLIVTLLTPYFLLLAGTIQASGKTPADLQGPEVPAGADPVPRPIDGRTVPGLSAAEPIEADPIPTAIPGGPRPYQLPDIRVETGPEPGRPSVASDPVEQFEIGPEGGSVSARNGKLRIWFPAGAVTETILVRVSDPPGVSGPPYSLSGQPFRIQAESMATGKRVDQFLQPLTIQLAYDERQVQGDEHWLTMYYWDRRRPGWVPLDSQVDTQADIVSGMTDHFTDFDIEVQSWQSRNLPTLQAFLAGSSAVGGHWRAVMGV